MRKIASVLIFAIMILAVSHAQTIHRTLISSSGDFLANSDYSMEWSLGEIVIGDFSESGIHLTQGFHQGMIRIIDKNKDVKDVPNLSVFPNPVSNWVQIEWSNPEMSPDRLELFDMAGKYTHLEFIFNAPGSIKFNMEPAQDGIYYLRVVFGVQAYSFKLIKQ